MDFLRSVLLFLCYAVFMVCGQDGPTFETCETMKCPENSKCVDYQTFVTCECPPGKAGMNCTMDDPCMETKVNCPPNMKCFGHCNPNVVCHGATGTAMCQGCMAGWTGPICNQCVGATCQGPKEQESKDNGSASVSSSTSVMFLFTSILVLITA